MENQFREYDMKEWPTLQTALQQQYPRSITILRWIETRIAWARISPGEYPFKILYPGDDFRNGIVTIGRPMGFAVYVTIYNFNKNFDILEKAFLNSDIINWKEETVVGMPNDIEAWMLGVMRKLKIEIPRIDRTQIYMMSAEKARNMVIDLPDDVYLAPLKPADIDIVNSFWLNEFESSEDFLKALNRLNFGLGLYSKKDHELRSWALVCEFGEMGSLHTLDQYRGKGYGVLMTKAMSMVLACQGLDPFGFILNSAASVKIANNLGQDLVGWKTWFFIKGKPSTYFNSKL